MQCALTAGLLGPGTLYSTLSRLMKRVLSDVDSPSLLVVAVLQYSLVHC